MQLRPAKAEVAKGVKTASVTTPADLPVDRTELVARMLDQDPIPTVTERIRDQLQRLRERHGL
jgi:hypothetical protein